MKTVKRRIWDISWGHIWQTFLEDWACKVRTREETQMIPRILSLADGEIIG